MIVDTDVKEPASWKTAKTLPMPPGYPGWKFDAAAWSPDGRWIAGTEGDGTGRVESYAIYDLEKQSLRHLAIDSVGGLAGGGIAGWLPDSRSLALQRGTAVMIYDTVSGATRPILAGHQYDTLRLARNGEILMVEEAVLDSDIWLFEFE